LAHRPGTREMALVAASKAEKAGKTATVGAAGVEAHFVAILEARVASVAVGAEEGQRAGTAVRRGLEVATVAAGFS